MRYSTLKYYAAGVCLITGLCFAVAFGKSLWDGAQVYINDAEQTDLYRFYHAGSKPACNSCSTDTSDNTYSLNPAQPTLSPYGQEATPQHADMSAHTPKPTEDVSSALHDMLVRLGLAGAAGMIFFLHWRLYKNLSAVTE